MAQFTRIGNGFIHESKSGNKSINLVLDPAAQEQLMNHDWERGIHVFKSDYKTKKGQTYYSIMAPMPDDYEYKPGKGFSERKKEVEETLL